MMQLSHRVPKRTLPCTCGRLPRLIEVRGSGEHLRNGDWFLECASHIRTEPSRSARAALKQWKARRFVPVPPAKPVPKLAAVPSRRAA